MKQLTSFNRILYVLFTVIGLFYGLFFKNFGQAPIYLGLALAFDPFDPSIPWKQRPLYQKIIPLVQVGITAGLFGYEISQPFSK